MNRKCLFLLTVVVLACAQAPLPESLGNVDQNLAGTNLAGTNLAGTNLAGTNLAGTNLAGTNLAGTNLAGTNLAGTNLAGTNLAGTNLAGTNLAGTNLPGTNLAGTNLAGTNLAGTNLGYNIHGAGSQGLLYTGEDTWAGERCLHLGVSATGFAALVLAQGGSDVQVAIGKLPWSLATPDGGPTAAWEALVWGDASYCDFIVAAPQNVSWGGVAGFFKAMFRWSEPPSRTIHLHPIEASAAVDPTIGVSLSYTGMMGTGVLWQNGTVPELNFLAGELAFISSTTNDESVLVDFASWVLDKDGNGVILGNVDPNTPTFVESVWSASLRDGAISVAVDDPARGVELPDGMTSVTADIGTAYRAYADGQGQRPAPKRCAPALYLMRTFATPFPTGKCDDGLFWPSESFVVGAQPWLSVTGLSGPNSYMLLPALGEQYRRGQAGDAATYELHQVLSETYVHAWASEYDLVP